MAWYEDEEKNEKVEEKKPTVITDYEELVEAFKIIKERLQVYIDEAGTLIVPIQDELDGGKDREGGLLGELEKKFEYHEQIQLMSIGRDMRNVLDKTKTLKKWQTNYCRFLEQFIHKNGFIHLVQSAISQLQLQRTEIRSKELDLKHAHERIKEMSSQKGYTGIPPPTISDLTTLDKTELKDRFMERWKKYVDALKLGDTMRANAHKAGLTSFLKKSDRRYETKREYLIGLREHLVGLDKTPNIPKSEEKRVLYQNRVGEVKEATIPPKGRGNFDYTSNSFSDEDVPKFVRDKAEKGKEKDGK